MSGQTEGDVDKKPIIARTHINVKFATQEEGSDVFIRIRKDVPLKKATNAYCENRGVAFNTYVFTFNGNPIGIENTPEQLEMEDGDEIDAFLHMDGGSK